MDCSRTVLILSITINFSISACTSHSPGDPVDGGTSVLRCGDNLSHCGSCSVSCVSEVTCVNGQCQCNADETQCSEVSSTSGVTYVHCSNLLRGHVRLDDRGDCGRCGEICGTYWGERQCSTGDCGHCVAGVCQTSSDGGVLTRCGSLTTNLDWNVDHCGRCDRSCRADECCRLGVCLRGCRSS